MTDFPPGTPSWIELASPELDSAVGFYEQLFGWTLTDPRPDFGGYRNFLGDGQIVAGANPMGQAPVWTTYFSVASAEETAAKVAEHGGVVQFEAMDVGDLGRMAICADPQGAVLGLWEPGTLRGAERVRELGALCWNDLHTTDGATAARFYEAVLGWRAEDMSVGDERYTVFNVGDQGVAGLGQSDASPHWLVWFAVAGADDTVARAQELGASLEGGPFDVPTVGRTAVLADPQGARFGVLQAELPDE